MAEIPSLLPTEEQDIVEVRLNVVGWLESLSAQDFSELLSKFPSDIQRSTRNWQGTSAVFLGVHLVRHPESVGLLEEFGRSRKQ